MSSRLFSGTLLLLAGVLLLFANMGVIPPGFWHNLISLWPLLLIALGLGMIFRKGILALLSPLVLVLMVVLAFTMPVEYYDDGKHVSFRQALDDAVTEARLVISTGAVDLRLRGSESGSTDLIFATEHVYTNPTVWSYRLDRSKAVVRASRSARSVFGFSRRGSWVESLRTDVTISTSVPWEIELNAGASSVSMDLRDVVVQRLDINGGVNRVDVELGDRADRASVNISGGLASVSLTVPYEAGVRVDMDAAFVGQNLKAMGFQRRDGVWFSPGYDIASKFIDIHLEGGLSSFNIHFLPDRGVVL